MNIQNRTVLITGGGSGIGYEVARSLSALGNRVIITGRNEDKLLKASKTLKNVTAIRCDVTNESDVVSLAQRIKSEFSDLSILMNNAGVAHVHNLHQGSDTFGIANQEVEINYLSVVRLTEHLLPVLKSQPTSAIINVTSIVVYAAGALIPTYSASKAALHAYTQVLRNALTDTSVKVFELMPPLVNTDMAKDIGGETRGIPSSEVSSQLLTAIQNDIYQIHVGMTADLYKVFLSSPEQAFKVLNQVA
jgi:uncharacterized oxidoreductase